MLHSHTGSLLRRNVRQQPKSSNKSSDDGLNISPQPSSQSHGLLQGHSGQYYGAGPRRSHKDFGVQVQMGRVLHDVMTNKNTKVDSRVVGGTLEESGGDKHVEYVLACTIQIQNHSRRYTEFKELDAALRARFPELSLPHLPDVSWRFKLFSRRTLDPSYVAAKGRLLNEYIQELAKIREVRSSPEFLTFILSPKNPPKTGENDSPVVLYKDTNSIEKHEIARNETSLQKEQETDPDNNHTLIQNKLIRSDSVSSGEEDFPETKLGDESVDLLALARQSSANHPLLSKLVAKKQPVSFPAYKSFEDLFSTSSVIISFDLLSTEICFENFSLNTNASVLSGKTILDGHSLRIDAQIKSMNPLSGVAIVSCVQTAAV